MRPTLLIDPDKTTPAQAAEWCTQFELALAIASSAGAIVPGQLFSSEVEAILRRHDRENPDLRTVRREVLAEFVDLGYLPTGPDSGRPYLRLLLGAGKERNFGYVSSIGIALVGGRHGETCSTLIEQGVVQTHNEQSEEHKYPWVSLKERDAIRLLAREHAARQAPTLI
jgi:hypothetical protein